MVIALVPQHARKINPPRTLSVPYELGRPLGIPNDTGFQHRILDAALKMLSHTGKPAFDYYPEEAPLVAKDTDSVWSCPVSFSPSTDSLSAADQVQAEISLLQPWYDRGKISRSYTSFGLSGLELSKIVQFLGDFLKEEPPTASPCSDLSLADALKSCAEDLKAFYNEAATSQPGNISADEAENWYWGETRAGALVREVKKIAAASTDNMLKITADFILVPHSQAFRDQ